MPKRARCSWAGWQGVSDPEQKRKIIGAAFIDVFDKESHKVGGAEFLAQGTLYPDVIESVSATGGPSVTIKSHHNVGGLPDYMKLKLVEPLRELFKDEVRALGRELGLPPAFVGRHPFPGSGPGHPHSRRDHAKKSWKSCARPTSSIWTRSARPASTTRSGRPLPCCCRSRPWA